jgi:glyoxylate reductase
VLDDTTAELAFALMLSVSRRVVEADQFVRQKKWTTGWEVNMFLGLDLNNKTLGIIGMGNIGRSLAKKASGFNMNIIYHNRNRLDKKIEKQYNATYVDKNTILKESDFISLHMPSTKETHHIITKEELSIMKSNAILINTARGTVVNEHDLYNALKEKTIWGAGLDVFEREPQITKELLNLNNVVVLPHIGSASIETRNKMSLMVANNIVAGLRGEIPPNLLNESVLSINK